MAQGVKRTRNPFSVFHNSFCCHVPSLQNYEAKYEEKYKQKKKWLTNHFGNCKNRNELAS